MILVLGFAGVDVTSPTSAYAAQVDLRLSDEVIRLGFFCDRNRFYQNSEKPIIVGTNFQNPAEAECMDSFGRDIKGRIALNGA